MRLNMKAIFLERKISNEKKNIITQINEINNEFTKIATKEIGETEKKMAA
jgi:hypothetical protein